MTRRLRARRVSPRPRTSPFRPWPEALELRVAPAVLTGYPVMPPQPVPPPKAVVRGADGGIWFSASTFTAGNDQDVIGRVAPDGAVTDVLLPEGETALSLTAAPNGDLVFLVIHPAYRARPNSLGRITPGGVFTDLDFPYEADPSALAIGPDGNIWFGSVGSSTRSIGKLTPDGFVVYPTRTYIGFSSLVTGPDGNL